MLSTVFGEKNQKIVVVICGGVGGDLPGWSFVVVVILRGGNSGDLLIP